VKQKAWNKDKVDEEIAKKGQVEKADVTKQTAEYTLTINTCVNIIKIPNKFAKVPLQGTGLRGLTWKAESWKRRPWPPPRTPRTSTPSLRRSL
jgi:hypothetical protein